MNKHCKNCIKLRTTACDKPDICVLGGYKYWSPERRSYTAGNEIKHPYHDRRNQS